MLKSIVFLCILATIYFCYILTISSDNEYTNKLEVQQLNLKEYLNLAEYNVYSGKGTTIAILDSGISNHSDLNMNNLISFVDFTHDNKEMYDDNGHGTAITGIIAGDGEYQGIAPDTKYIIIKVLDEENQADYNSLMQSINWILLNHEKYEIDIINISLGIQSYISHENISLERKIQEMLDHGLIVVAAAGNSGPYEDTITFPGSIPGIISVEYLNTHHSYDYNDATVAISSSRGNNINCKPEIYIPAIDMKVLRKNSGYTIKSGSSFATAVVAGVLSLLLEKFPEFSPDQIRKELLDNTVEIDDKSVNCIPKVLFVKS
ncbi:S8 family serine peptidase [Marinicrinis sediminis]|uniref:S8 family serine peptidase n=1 Tax=Marinicrinis sediminis TaxID=1652465 RepID=A0ABW5RA09_9BACL